MATASPATALERNCTLVLAAPPGEPPRLEELKAKLENKDENLKIEVPHAPHALHVSRGMPRTGTLADNVHVSPHLRRAQALKQIIANLLNGEPMQRLLMHVIKFCLHTENHHIRKLLMLFWESIEKKQANGALLPEMILVWCALGTAFLDRSAAHALA
jgi:coatomer subunit beta